PKGEEAKAVMEAAFRCNVEPFFLGNGSNLLVSDKGYDGFAVKLDGTYSEGEVFSNELTAGGAMLLSRAANLALEHGLTGLEWAAGIPGTVGGAVTMNAGAYGGEICQVLHQVCALGRDGGSHVVSNRDCDFAYRHSAFSDGQRLILEAVFLLEPGDPVAIKAKMAELAAQRKEKQPLEYPSAGSTFKRPPAVDGKPVYAAALIDQCGCKGLTVGGAQVSEKHAGFIVNKGGATCADILNLVEEVRKRVLDQTGVTLELEVRTLGV
ncbi:MAG: UDP-N-acetylmuramate dehydrogenase, partial [Oscillospiraceae bacterium]|nr:UDP-N-acetylmuramate dehydrogenase [Oscillospiraceae bacterium]